MERTQCAKQIAFKILDRLRYGDTAVFVATLYLVSDIAFNSLKSSSAWTYIRVFEQHLPAIFNNLLDRMAAPGRLTQSQVITATLKVL